MSKPIFDNSFLRPRAKKPKRSMSRQVSALLGCGVQAGLSTLGVSKLGNSASALLGCGATLGVSKLGNSGAVALDEVGEVSGAPPEEATSDKSSLPMRLRITSASAKVIFFRKGPVLGNFFSVA